MKEQNKKLKIAIVYDMLYPCNIGGVEVRNYEIAKRLGKKGHEVHLFGVKLWKGKDIIKRGGIFYHGICHYSDLYNFKGQRKIWEPIKLSLVLPFKLLKYKFDIIDCSTFPYFTCFPCKIVSVIKKTPLIFTWHQYWGDYWYLYLGKIRGFFGKIIEKSTKYLTKNHLAISKTTKNDLIKEGVKKNNIFINYDGIDLKEINSVKQKKKKYDIVFVGRLIHQKQVDLLIKSLALIKKENKKIRACIVGDGPDKEKLENLTKSLDLDENIKFTGFLKNKKQVYEKMKSSKIFVLPSLLEGFGIVVIEAMACSLPVIVTNTKYNASKELIDDNKNGFIVKNNPKALALAIKKLLKDKKLREETSKEAGKKAKQFDWNKITENLERYYFRIMKKNGN